MGRLTAVFPVLFKNHNYEPGDELPADDEGLVKDWICNGTAVWKEDSEPERLAVKAKPATALPGITGDAGPSAGAGQDLAGKVPSRKLRGAQPEPSRGRRKSSA